MVKKFFEDAGAVLRVAMAQPGPMASRKVRFADRMVMMEQMTAEICEIWRDHHNAKTDAERLLTHQMAKAKQTALGKAVEVLGRRQTQDVLMMLARVMQAQGNGFVVPGLNMLFSIVRAVRTE